MFNLIKKFIVLSMLIASFTVCQSVPEQSKDDQENSRDLQGCVKVGLAAPNNCCRGSTWVKGICLQN